VLLPIVAAAGAAILIATARRPVIGCAVLAAGVPLSTALGRDTIIPVLRPNEAILLLVIGGLVLHHLWYREAFAYHRLDIAVTVFAVGLALIPWVVLWAAHTWIDFDTWRAVLGSLQFLAVYICFAQLRTSDRDLRRLLNLTLLVSVIVGVIAIVELQDFPGGARSALMGIFPPDRPISIWDNIYRPTSTLGVYGAVGAFAALNFILALTLANQPNSRRDNLWLTFVMVVNLGSVVASLTWAPAAALLVGASAVIWYARRVPWQVWVGIGAVLVAIIVLWPAVSQRIDQQQVGMGNVATLDQRFRNWQVFFLPVLAEHLWLGSGTLLPPDLPPYLMDFADNEFVRIGFRAGLVGLALLTVMLTVVGVTAWQCRQSRDPWTRALGALVLATVLTIVLTGFTAEYLSFGGLSQYIAMLFGLLASRLRTPALVPFLARGALIPTIPSPQIPTFPAPLWGQGRVGG
jgi:O-Antigen ligase